ncbi:MAG: hypothetical protein AAFR04_14990 [Pseudomonadota bacterium]
MVVEKPKMAGSRSFVALVFTLLGASFLVLPIMLAREFAAYDWFGIAFFHSYLFVFYPVFGVLALFAFFTPASIFTHFYWTHVRYGRVRFMLGFVTAILFALVISNVLVKKPPRAVWEVSPQIHQIDAGNPPDCALDRKPCSRAPMLDTMFAVREASRNRLGLTGLVRECRPDNLLETSESQRAARYCFPARAKRDATTCCRAQASLQSTVDRYARETRSRSQTGRIHDWLLPFKTFFVIVTIVIGLMLIFWRPQVTKLYQPLIPQMERGVLIGGIAMLFWPFMEYGYVQSSGAMYGQWGIASKWKVSLISIPWAMLLLFYFTRRFGHRGENLARMAGTVISGVALLRYEDLMNIAVRSSGSGAGLPELMVMLALFGVGLAVLLWPRKNDALPNAMIDENADLSVLKDGRKGPAWPWQRGRE